MFLFFVVRLVYNLYDNDISSKFDRETHIRSLSLTHKFNIDSLTIIALTSQKTKKKKTTEKNDPKYSHISRTFTKRHVYYLLSSAILFTKRYPHKNCRYLLYMSTIPHKPIQHEPQLKTEEENTEIRNTVYILYYRVVPRTTRTSSTKIYYK